MLDVFLHIPKTAGRSLQRVLQLNYHSDRIASGIQPGLFFPEDRSGERPVRKATRETINIAALPKENSLLSGHIPFDCVESFRQQIRIFTVLRDPFDRLVSEYNHAATLESHYLYSHIALKGISFEDYCLSGFTLTSDNLQTRFLSGTHYRRGFSDVTADDFALAESNMRNFEGLGLQERFSETLLILSHIFGWKRRTLSTRNVGWRKKIISAADIDPTVIRKIYELNKFDLQLYNSAVAEFEKRLCEYRNRVEGDWVLPDVPPFWQRLLERAGAIRSRGARLLVRSIRR